MNKLLKFAVAAIAAVAAVLGTYAQPACTQPPFTG